MRRWACCGSRENRVCCRRERQHESLVREPDAANPQVRFDEREVETGHGELLGHRQPKGPATRKASPSLPRHLPTLLHWLGGIRTQFAWLLSPIRLLLRGRDEPRCLGPSRGREAAQDCVCLRI